MGRIITKVATRDDKRWLELFDSYQAIEVITDARIKVIADNYRFDLNVAQSEMEVHNLRRSALRDGVPVNFANYYADRALWGLGCKSKASFALATAV